MVVQVKQNELQQKNREKKNKKKKRSEIGANWDKTDTLGVCAYRDGQQKLSSCLCSMHIFLIPNILCALCLFSCISHNLITLILYLHRQIYILK